MSVRKYLSRWTPKFSTLRILFFLLPSLPFTMTSNDEKEFFTTVADLDVGKSDLVEILPRLPVDEAHSDFYGLPSNPISIYHTGAPWLLPTGPQAQRVQKEARPVCIHPIAPMWPKIGERIYKYFDSVHLKWTSIDPVRFAEVGKEPGPLFLWVGVVPRTLSCDDAKVAAKRCKEILAEYEINDVEIAFRESIFTRSAGPQLLKHVPSVDPTANVRGPFTPALGLRIAPKAFPHFEGTGCLYLREGGKRNRALLLTARHVVLPISEYPNNLYHRSNDCIPCREVIHLGSKAYQDALEAIMKKIEHDGIMVNYYKDEIEGLGEVIEGEDPDKADTRKAFEVKLEEAKKSIASVNKFQDSITTFWSADSQRVLGHILYAPPISVSTGDKRFTKDLALIELNDRKFDWDTFRGNVIDLAGAKFTPSEFMRMMYPRPESRAKFRYPRDGLVQLRDFVKDDELRCPTMLDSNGENCLIVIKNGTTTGVTIGRATGIESFVRDYTEYGIHSTSMEVAIYPYGHNYGAFSAAGDSGSVVGDANNRIVGMITGGAGLINSTDVTYATPYYFMDEHIKKAFPNSHLFPIPA